jgi:hypothetical protein
MITIESAPNNTAAAQRHMWDDAELRMGNGNWRDTLKPPSDLPVTDLPRTRHRARKNAAAASANGRPFSNCTAGMIAKRWQHRLRQYGQKQTPHEGTANTTRASAPLLRSTSCSKWAGNRPRCWGHTCEMRVLLNDKSGSIMAQGPRSERRHYCYSLHVARSEFCLAHDIINSAFRWQVRINHGTGTQVRTAALLLSTARGPF